MHPVKFLSRRRGGGLWWPSGLLLNFDIGKIFFNPDHLLFSDNWSEKAKRRRTQGVGRMRHMKVVFRRFK